MTALFTVDGNFDANEGARLPADRFGHEGVGNGIAELIRVTGKHVLGGSDARHDQTPIVRGAVKSATAAKSCVFVEDPRKATASFADERICR